MDGTLQFLVMVDADLDRPGMVQAVLDRFPEATPLKENSCDLRGNWLEVWDNEDADREQAADPDDGYLHFRWRVEVTPLDDTLDEDHQVRLARDLRDCFAAVGRDAVVAANFEHRV